MSRADSEPRPHSESGSPAAPVDRTNAEHYTWGETQGPNCDGWRLLRSTGLSVIEERMPPGARETRHFHRSARQFFYVLAGELTMELNGKMHVLQAGQGLEIAPGEAHQARNESAEDTRFLVVSQPFSHDDRVPAESL